MNDEVESVTPMSDRPHPRTVAREAIASYRMATVFTDGTVKQWREPPLTQTMIDGRGSRSTADYTRRAVRGHHASLLRRLLNLLR